MKIVTQPSIQGGERHFKASVLKVSPLTSVLNGSGKDFLKVFFLTNQCLAGRLHLCLRKCQVKPLHMGAPLPPCAFCQG